MSARNHQEKTPLNAANRILGFTSVLTLAVVLAAAPARAQDVVRIGFASPLTGGQANYGKDNQNGAQLAIDELNAQGLRIGGRAIKFELLAEDDQADPKMGPVVAQKLVDAKVAGVVGHFNSGVTIPASKVYSDAGIPQLSVSTNVKYTMQGYKTAFRLMADDGKQGKALGEYAVKTLKFKRLAVVDDSTAYGQGLADEFERAVRASGAQVVKHEHTNDKAVDFATLLTSIKGAALESRPGGKAFADKYKARYKQDVGLYGPYFYDGVMLIGAAMKAADSTDPAKYLPALAKIKYEGITANIAFDDRGDLTQGLLTIFEVKNGKWVVISK
jgi:branched-chain amino acid transport system substrate-binding protein